MPDNDGPSMSSGRFIREDILATGGHGVLYKGRDSLTGETVVIKQLKPELVIQHPKIIARFAREGETLRQLNHPNIVKMVAVEKKDGVHSIIMEYVPSGSLRDLLKDEGYLSVPRVLDIGLELADALTRTHHLGIIHRDLKPSNVLMAKDGTPRLTDFGIAFMSKRDTRLTQDGAFMGSPPYMSPEACLGEKLDTRSDIWSFGVLLFEMLSGQLPFDGETITAVLIAILNDPTPDLTRFQDDIPPPLADLIVRMLAKEREQRIGSMRQVAAELEAVRDGTPLEIQAKTLAVTTAEEGSIWEPDVSLPAFLAHKDPDVAALPVFVAREKELERLERLLEEAIAGQGKVTFVVGGPGRGKSSLLQAFADRAQAIHPNLVVAFGLCNDFSGIGDPYLPFRQVLAMLAGDVEGAWRAGRISGEGARRLWQTLPETAQALLESGPDLLDTLIKSEPLLKRLATAVPPDTEWLTQLQQMIDIRKAAPASPDIKQINLFTQFTRVLQGVSRKAPLVILVDDLQWADAASIGLLFHLGRMVADGRFLIVGAYRPEEVALGREGERHPLERVVNELQRLYGEAPIRLGQEGDEPGRTFVDAYLDSEPNQLDNDFRQAMTKLTGGHALFVVELARAMQERGELYQDESGQWRAAALLDWEQLPTRVEAVIAERIDRLEEELREILSVASVEGEEFTAQVVAQVQNVQERQMFRALSLELDKRHRLVRERGRLQAGRKRFSRYRFAHHLFQRYLYNELSEGERQWLHGEIAAVLEELFADSLDELAVQLAYHYREAGLDDKALQFTILAGEQSLTNYAYQEAEKYLSAALNLTQDEGEKARLLVLLGKTLGPLNRHDDAQQTWQKAIDIHLKEEEWSMAAELYALSGRAVWMGGETKRSLEICHQGLKMVEKYPDSPGLARLLSETARTAFFNAVKDKVEEKAVRALKMAALFELTDLKADTLITLGLIKGYHSEELVPLMEEAIQIAESTNNYITAARAYNNLAIWYMNQGDAQTSLQLYWQAIHFAHQIGDVGHELLFSANLLGSLYPTGRLQEAEKHLVALNASIDLIPDFGEGGKLLQHLEAVYLRYKGEFGAYMHLAEKLIQHDRKENNLQHLRVALVNNGLIFLAKGEYQLAEEAFQEAMKTTLVEGDDFDLHCWVSISASKQAALPKASEHLEQARHLTKNLTPTFQDKSIFLNAEAQLALARRNWRFAWRNFEQVLELQQKYEMRWNAAWIKSEWAEGYLFRGKVGDVARAQQMLEEARSEFEEMGATGWVALVNEKLASFD